MRKHDFSYFFGEGMRNMFSHGFMSFAAVGITVACLVVMGTFSLVAYNAQVQLQQLESEYEILAFVDESCDDAQTKAVGRAIEQRDNVKECVFISKEEAMKSFEARYEGDNMFQNLDPEILRDRYAVYVDDLSISGKTAQDIFDNVEGVANVRVDEDIAGGFITLRNVASVVCIALIAILLLVSVFIISNTIKLTTFDRRDEIAIMKMVGATNSFIRWPFVYEGFMIGLLSAVLGFGLQWLLYESVAKSLAMSDRLQLLTIVDFTSIWRPVAAIFAAAGILIGVGGSLTAIRKFLHVFPYVIRSHGICKAQQPANHTTVLDSLHKALIHNADTLHQLRKCLHRTFPENIILIEIITQMNDITVWEGAFPPVQKYEP